MFNVKKLITTITFVALTLFFALFLMSSITAITVAADMMGARQGFALAESILGVLAALVGVFVGVRSLLRLFSTKKGLFTTAPKMILYGLGILLSYFFICSILDISNAAYHQRAIGDTVIPTLVFSVFSLILFVVRLFFSNSVAPQFKQFSPLLGLGFSFLLFLLFFIEAKNNGASLAELQYIVLLITNAGAFTVSFFDNDQLPEELAKDLVTNKNGESKEVKQEEKPEEQEPQEENQEEQ